MSLPVFVVNYLVGVEDGYEVVNLVVPARIPDQPSPLSHDELHAAVVVFGEDFGLGVRCDFRGGNEEAVGKVVVCSWQGRVAMAKNGFNCAGVHAVCCDDEISCYDLAI